MEEEHDAAGRMNGVGADGVGELVQDGRQAETHRDKDDDVPRVRESGRHPGAGEVPRCGDDSAGGDDLAPVGLSLSLEIELLLQYFIDSWEILFGGNFRTKNT